MFELCSFKNIWEETLEIYTPTLHNMLQANVNYNSETEQLQSWNINSKKSDSQSGTLNNIMNVQLHISNHEQWYSTMQKAYTWTWHISTEKTRPTIWHIKQYML